MRSEAEIKDLVAELELDPDLRELHSEQEEMLAMYNLDFAISRAKDATPIKAGTARSKVDYAVDHLITDKPVASCDNPKDTQKSQALTDRTENWAQRFLYHMDRVSIESPVRDLAKSGILWGMFILFAPLYLPECIPPKPVREKGQKRADYDMVLANWEGQLAEAFPFMVRPVCPINFYFPMSLGQPDYGVEIGERRALEVRKLLEWLGIKYTLKKEYKDSEKIKWGDFWSKTELGYLVDGDVVYRASNPYGFNPYYIGTAGFGNLSPSMSPSERFRGLLVAAKTSLLGESELLTALVAKSKLQAYGKWWSTKAEMPTGPVGGLGTITEFPDGSGGPRPWPDSKVSEDDYRLLQQFKGQIDQETYSQALAGVFPAVSEPGYGRAIAIGQAKTKFQVLMVNLQRCMETMLRRGVWVQKNIIQEPLFEERFRPEELLDNPSFHVELQASDTQENYNRIDQGLKLLQAGAITLKEFKEQYEQNPDATQAIKDLLAERAVLANQQAINEYAAQVWSMKTAEARLKEQAAAAPNVLPAEGLGNIEGAPPPMPAPQGSAEEMDLVRRRMANQGAPIGQMPGGMPSG